MKKTLLLIYALLLFLLPLKSLHAASWQAFSIVKYLGYGELLITDGNYYYQIDYSYGCSFSSLDEGNVVYVDIVLPSFYPMYGNDIYYEDDYGNIDTCTVGNFPEQLDFSSFTIEKYLGSDGLLVVDDKYSYIVDYPYDCSFSSLDEGNAIYINSILAPSYGDEIYYSDGYGGAKFCKVNNFPERLNLYSILVTDINSLDNEIIVENNTDRYSIELGYGCSAYNFLLNKDAYVDSLDSSLDTYDTLYNFNGSLGYDECSILKVTFLPDTIDMPSDSDTDDNNDNNADTKIDNDKTFTSNPESDTSEDDKKYENAESELNTPSNLTVKILKKGRVNLLWDNINKAAYYDIQLKQGGTLIKDFLNLKKQKQKIGKKYLKKNRIYKFRVRACDANSCSVWSKYEKFIISK